LVSLLAGIVSAAIQGNETQIRISERLAARFVSNQQSEI